MQHATATNKKMKSTKQMRKEVRALITSDEKQAYIDALTEQEAAALFMSLLSLP
jgi:hypothetical protein